MTVHREQNMKREDQKDATIRCLLLTSVSTCFGHHYAHIQENKGPVIVVGVLFWFCWLWLVVVVGRYLAGLISMKVSVQQNRNLQPSTFNLQQLDVYY